MTCTKQKKRIVFVALLLIYASVYAKESVQPFYKQVKDFERTLMSAQYHEKLQVEKPTIKNIIIINTDHTLDAAIKMRLPFKVGQPFESIKTAAAIKNVYALGYFKQVEIAVDHITDHAIDLYIHVEPMPRLSHVTFTGNKAITDKKLKEELNIDKTPALNEDKAKVLARTVEKLYRKKNFHHATVNVEVKKEEKGQVSAHFTIHEGKKSHVERISFTGNKSFTHKQLKKILFTKEDWPFGFLTNSGVYQPEMLLGDRMVIEEGYKNNGFVNAKVKNVDVQLNKQSNNYHITYDIHEGDMYYISDVTAKGNDILSEDDLRRYLLLFPGQRYSQEKIRDTIENLRMAWGEHGYIFADIEPAIDIDHDKKTVSVTFFSDIKNKYYLHRVTLKGNKKTRDQIIRRQLMLDEGELITNRNMEISKHKVAMLGYFDPQAGVNWKITRLNETQADLDLMLQEIKTGKFDFNFGYGGSPTNPSSTNTGITGSILIKDSNLSGTGVAASAMGEFSKNQNNVAFNIFQPYLFDYPIKGQFGIYHKRSENEEITDTKKAPFSITTGATLGLGYVTPWFDDIVIEGQLGFETVKYDPEVEASDRLGANKEYYQFILDRNFQEGDQYWLRASISQDKRNRPVFTNHGYRWNWYAQLAFPMTDKGFNYFKTELDWSYFTPLIGEDSMVLGLHSHLGFITPINDSSMPWSSLFHIGGPATVRGYTYGQIGPTWGKDSLGGTKALYVKAELTIPLTPDLSKRAVIFYDGGAGWDVPHKNYLRSKIPNFDETLKNDDFFYRHSVGVGIRIQSPSIQIDWGLKLNPPSNTKNLAELHFSMSREF